MSTGAYPLPAFYFQLVIDGTPGVDQAFQEVSGITVELETEEVTEGGENRFVHRLPKNAKHPLLELKRGIAPMNSPLVAWCMKALESDFTQRITPKMIEVSLLNANGDPVRHWSFANAYPVKFEVSSFNSTKNEVAIETISLSYTYSNRTM